MTNLKTLEKQKSKIQEKINKMRDKEMKEKTIPFLKSFKGQCYKYRNNSSCPTKKSDWWSYCKLLDHVTDKDGLLMFIVEEFGIDNRGAASYRVYSEFTYPNGREPMSYWTKIEEGEYNAACAEFFDEAFEQSKLRKTLKSGK